MAAPAAIREIRRDLPEKIHHICSGIHAVCTAELDKLSVEEALPELRAVTAESVSIVSTKLPNSLDGEMQSAARYR